jgi:very-short-patch-repair endonuclease
VSKTANEIPAADYRAAAKKAEQEAPTLALLAQIQAKGLPEPERETRFHPTRKWRLDISWPALKVGVEVDGGVWSRGRHVRGAGFIEDQAKCNEAACRGWLVLRVCPDTIKSGKALVWIETAIALRKECDKCVT